MAPKGLSADAKRDRMLELFYETRDVMNLKELEKLAPKRGIILQAVKDTVLGLVSDGLVQSDKVGSGQYYWSFPSQRGVTLKNAHNAKMTQLANLQAQVAQLEQELIEAQQGREDTDERKQRQSRYLDECKRHERLDQKMSLFSVADPAQFQKRNDDILVLREACMFWTDATSAAISYIRDRAGHSSDELRKQLEIPDDFEDLGWPDLVVPAPDAVAVAEADVVAGADAGAELIEEIAVDEAGPQAETNASQADNPPSDVPAAPVDAPLHADHAEENAAIDMSIFG